MLLLFRSDLREPCGIRGDNTRNLTSTFSRHTAVSSLHLVLYRCRVHTQLAAFAQTHREKQSQLKSSGFASIKSSATLKRGKGKPSYNSDSVFICIHQRGSCAAGLQLDERYLLFSSVRLICFTRVGSRIASAQIVEFVSDVQTGSKCSHMCEQKGGYIRLWGGAYRLHHEMAVKADVYIYIYIEILKKKQREPEVMFQFAALSLPLQSLPLSYGGLCG